MEVHANFAEIVGLFTEIAYFDMTSAPYQAIFRLSSGLDKTGFCLTCHEWDCYVVLDSVDSEFSTIQFERILLLPEPPLIPIPWIWGGHRNMTRDEPNPMSMRWLSMDHFVDIEDTL